MPLGELRARSSAVVGDGPMMRKCSEVFLVLCAVFLACICGTRASRKRRAAANGTRRRASGCLRRHSRDPAGRGIESRLRRRAAARRDGQAGERDLLADARRRTRPKRAGCTPEDQTAGEDIPPTTPREKFGLRFRTVLWGRAVRLGSRPWGVRAGDADCTEYCPAPLHDRRERGCDIWIVRIPAGSDERRPRFVFLTTGGPSDRKCTATRGSGSALHFRPPSEDEPDVGSCNSDRKPPRPPRVAGNRARAAIGYRTTTDVGLGLGFGPEWSGPTEAVR